MTTRTRLRLLCGAIGGPLFVLVFLVEGARRDGYDPMREPVSSLALGQRGWIQRANFVGIQRLTIALGWSWLLVLAADGLSNRLGNGGLRHEPALHPANGGVTFGMLDSTRWPRARRPG